MALLARALSVWVPIPKMSDPVTVPSAAPVAKMDGRVTTTPLLSDGGKHCDGVCGLVVRVRTCGGEIEWHKWLPSRLGRWGKSNSNNLLLPDCLRSRSHCRNPMGNQKHHAQDPVGTQRGHRIIVPVTGKNWGCEALSRDRELNCRQ